ncbi:M48 family metallopeptidase [Candidatus Marinimicrobia bacterium MT.SAG.3]|nr:M48 family metallopeptidase [Candidatus Marinimicrobia bacterium MT.SAG.3]
MEIKIPLERLKTNIREGIMRCFENKSVNLPKRIKKEILTIILSLLIFPSILLAQDVLYRNNGTIIKGEYDSKSSSDTSLRFKPNYQAWTYYHVNTVNFIKSFNGNILYPTGIIANLKSNKYHLPIVKHLPEKADQKYFETIDDADNAGFIPCSVCFDDSPTISDYYYERELIKNYLLNIQSNYEIIGAHPQLPQIRSILDTIVKGWPEVLKGYDYRVQIYEDDYPNAFAIGGGYIFISSGLLNMIEDDSELEAVLAHEIGHNERRHLLRVFKKHQNNSKNSMLLAVFIGAATYLATLDTDRAVAGILITKAVTDVVSEISLKGYSREMEQEADILAQLYFHETESSSNPLIRILDKFATYSLTRNGFIPRNSILSTHPHIKQRILQVQNTSIFKYDDPLTFEAYPVKRKDLIPGFIKLKINYVFMAPSSTKDETVCSLVGSIINEHPEYNFTINNLTFNFLSNVGIRQLDGFAGNIIKHQSESDFIGVIRVPSNKSQDLMEVLKNKSFLPYSMDISNVVILPGKDAKKIGYRPIQCRMTIK